MSSLKKPKPSEKEGFACKSGGKLIGRSEKPRPKPSQAEEQGKMTQVLKPERVVKQFLGEPYDEFVRVEFPQAFGFGQARQDLKNDHVTDGQSHPCLARRLSAPK